MEQGPPLARRMAETRPFRVMELLAEAQRREAAGADIVHMEVGEPDFATPAPVGEAARRALDAGQTRYTPAAGLPELREAIAGHYAEAHGVNVDPARIVVTPGASGALQLVLAALLDPGARVLLPDPGYPCNRNFVRLFEGAPELVPVAAEADYQLTPEQIAGYWDGRTAAAMVASPANPTGSVIGREALTALDGAVAERGGALVADEIYQGLVYGKSAPSALEVSNRAFVVNSFSKFFGMTGWRLGWVVAPEGYAAELEKLAGNIFLAPPTLAQHAALAAFSPESQKILVERREAFRERRDFLLPALRELGFRIPGTPAGAFYIYADCTPFTDNTFAFAERILAEAGVALTPGRDFGDHRPEAHVRFAYTTGRQRLEAGIERLAAFLGSP